MSKRGNTSAGFKQKRGRSYRRARYDAIALRKKYLIVCEGEKTEPYYFDALGAHLPKGVVVVTEGTGKNTLTLVDHAIAVHKKMQKAGEGADEVWVVFDRDSFPPANFDNAITKCEAWAFNNQDGESNTFKCAWSNESFELWYVLHFKDVTAPIGREDLNRKLSELLGYSYNKAEKNFYNILQEMGDEVQAIARAERLLQQATPPWHSANPATTVHELVKELLTQKKE